MSSFTAIIQPESDGTLRLPVPPELRGTKVKVEARLERAVSDEPPMRAKAGLWKKFPDRFWMSADFDAPLEDFREYME